MKTKTKRLKPWNKLTQKERVARVNSAYGRFAGKGGGVEEFLREKHEEIERQEQRYNELYPR
jgi:hypothetical protein